MKNFLLIILLLSSAWNLRANELPKVLQQVLVRDTSYEHVSCEVKIQIDIPGLTIPEKTVSIEAEKGKELLINGDGILFLPRNGLLGQYKTLLDTPVQTIDMGSKSDTLIYKLVSLSDTSDWITADVYVTSSDALVHKVVLATRNNGTFQIQHVYKNAKLAFPSKTVLLFDAIPIKLPLKFMGQTSGAETLFNADKPLEGKVTLQYFNVDIN